MSKIKEIISSMGFESIKDIEGIKDDIIYTNILKTTTKPDGLVLEEIDNDLYICLTLDNKLGIDFLSEVGLLGITGYIYKANNLSLSFKNSPIRIVTNKGAIIQEGGESRYEEHIYMFSNELVLNGYCPIKYDEGFTSGIYIGEIKSSRFFSTTLVYKISKTKIPPKKKSKPKVKKEGLFISDSDFNVMSVAFDTKTPVLLLGPTGTGKTTIIKELSKQKKIDLIRINLNGEITKEDLVGSKTLVAGEVVWQDGPLTTALREGKILLLDEINAALPEVLLLIQSLTESKEGELGELRLNENFGELIVPHKDCRVFATGNPGSEYVGTKDFNPSTLSRFIILEINYLDKNQETELFYQKFASDLSSELMEAINILTTLAQELRKLKNREDILYSCSTRDIEQALSLFIKGIPLTDTVKVAIHNKAQLKEDQKIIKDLYIKTSNGIKGLKK